MKREKKMDLIVYHNNCPDGFTAAYIAKLKYPEAELVPRDHGAEIDLERLRDKDVLAVDCNIRGRNDEVAAMTKSYQVIDHHKSETDIIGKSYVVYDVKRSGAGLAWDYLLGKDSAPIPTVFDPAAEGLPRPWWVNYVEDRDLWNWKLPNSREVNAYIMTFSYTLESWKQMTQVNMDDAITNGKAIQLQIDKYVREAAKQAQPGRLNQYSVAVVNIPYLNTSEVGEQLAKTSDIGMGWFERADGMIQFSLRSEGDIDVSVIAKSFGGGGHKHAAGLQLNLKEGRAFIDSILSR